MWTEGWGFQARVPEAGQFLCQKVGSHQMLLLMGYQSKFPGRAGSTASPDSGLFFSNSQGGGFDGRPQDGSRIRQLRS